MVNLSKKIYLAGIAVCLINVHSSVKAGNFLDMLVSIFSSGQTNPTHNSGILTEQQAAQYVNGIISSIERSLRPFTPSSELHELKQIILNTIQGSSITYQWTSYGKEYKKDMIDQFINSALLEHIEKQSYNYAFELIRNTIIAHKIAESMRNNAMAKISQLSTINGDVIAQFFGENLKQSVRQAAHNYDAPYQQNYTNYTPSQPSYAPTAPPIEQATNKCFFCDDSFNKVARIVLRPCGHDLCKQCSLDWFFKKHENACPSCMNTVNKDLLKQEIQNTPWPTQQATASSTTFSSSSIANNSGNYGDNLYPSDECCICFDSFDSGARVFMHPCGHDMCKDCAKEWFFKQNKSTCPHCRTNVDKTKLQRDINA